MCVCVGGGGGGGQTVKRRWRLELCLSRSGDKRAGWMDTVSRGWLCCISFIGFRSGQCLRQDCRVLQ